MMTVAPCTEGLERFVAFDFGPRRTGVASGNRLLRSAQPRGTLDAVGQARWPLVDRVLREWQPDALVVGVPRHPDGQPHAMTQQARRFARQLRGRYRLPVFEIDERYSTTEARAAGARDADAEAARIILEQFLRTLP